MALFISELSALPSELSEDLLYSLQYGGGVGILRIIISPYLHVGFTILFESA